MHKVTLSGLPARRSADYQLDEFDPPRYARVSYVPKGTQNGVAEIEAQAFEVDADGVLQAHAETGRASRTSGTTHVIALSGMGDTHTLHPGWVRAVGSFDPKAEPGSAQAAPEGTVTADALPTVAATAGDHVWVDSILYRWDEGAIETIMQAKAAELAGVLRNSDLMGELSL